MMIFFGLAAAYFTLFSAGLGVTLSIFRGARRLNLLECCCLSWLFGTGVVSLLLWMCGTFLSGFVLQIVVATLCVAFGVLGLRAKHHAQARFTLPLPSGLLEWFLASVLVIEIAAVLLASCKHTLGWDGLLVWEIKARYAFINGGSIPASYYSNPGRAFSHPEYPLGIPFTELWLYLWMGQAHQFWVKTIFAIFYAAGATLLGLLATRLSGQCWSGLLVAILLPFIPFLTSAPGGVIVAYADFPLAVLYLAALGYLICSLAKGETASFAVYAGCLALLPWTKREGLILWSVLVLLGFVATLRQRKLSQFALSLLPSFAIMVSWRLYLTSVRCIPPSEFSLPTFGKLHDNLSRVVPICRALIHEMSDKSHWSIFWLLAAIAIVYLLVRFHDVRGRVLVSAVVAPIIVYCATYLFSTWPSYSAHITSSLPRLLLHVVPITWLAVAAVLPFPSVQRKPVTSASVCS